MNPEDVLRIIGKHENQQGSVITILEDIQAAYNYLPKDALKMVAKKTNHSLVDIYGIATFYKSFSLEPRGRHLMSVCTGTACHVRGARQVLDEFERQLKVEAGHTTPDREFTLSTVNCVGACALGPVVVVDGEFERNVSASKVEDVVDRCRNAERQQGTTEDERLFGVRVACPSCNRSLLTHDHLLDGYPMVHVTVAFARKHGWLRLSGLYGDYRIESQHEIPLDTVMQFFCPRCHAELRSTRQCARCDAVMIPLLVQGGGIIQVCARRGCKEHMLDLGD